MRPDYSSRLIANLKPLQTYENSFTQATYGYIEVQLAPFLHTGNLYEFRFSQHLQ
jgi:hypothetical protein